MAVYTDPEKWVASARRRMDDVARKATFKLFDAASQTAPAKALGGSVKPGFIPKDSGNLAESAVASLNGGTILSGERSFVAVVAQMKAGDEVTVGWTAPYADKVHYSGWLWMDTAANRWRQFVMAAVAEVKNQ